MHTVKTLTLAVVVTVLFAAAPQARAQDMAQIQLMQTFLDLMTQYYAIIESTHGIASDSEKAAIMQMQKIQEVYEDRGDKAKSVDVLKQVLEDSDNRAIRNAAYLMIGDTLKESGRASEALEYLQRGLAENIRAAD